MYRGSTPLRLGAHYRYLGLVDLLISSLVGLLVGSWANSRTPTIMALTASETGSQDSLPEISEPPLYDGVLSNDMEGTSLHGALESGRFAVVQELLDRSGADVNERDNLLRTPLAVASKHGELEIARTVIKYGADVNSRDTTGRTPLHTAAEYGHTDVARLLLDNGTDVNATQMEDSTALHTASMFGHFEVVQLLLERGANAQTRCVYGRTPSQYASMYGHQKIAQLLSEDSMGGVLALSERASVIDGMV